MSFSRVRGAPELAITSGVSAAVAVSAFVVWALAGSHPASTSAIVVFHLACAGVVALALPAPRSHAYTALAIFFALGFWSKFVLRLVRPGPYLEPVGRFDDSTAAWDAALATVVAAAAGIMLARLVHLWVARRRPPALPAAVPAFYARRWRIIWALTVAVTAALYAWNAVAAVHMTGLVPRIVLPFSGNAALAFGYQIGLAMWFAVLVEWELARRASREMTLGLLAVPVVEGIVNAGSLLSRSSFILRLLPYLLATTRARHGLRFRSRWWAVLATLGAGFAVSLALVMVLRVNIYVYQRGATFVPPAPAAAAGTTSEPAAASSQARESGYLARPVVFAVVEVSRLFIDRWTGMEGVLAVTSAERGPWLLSEALREDPAAGVHAIYQRLAGSTYEAEADYSFATLAGAVAVLAMAGSLAVVWAGMLALAALGMATEALARRFSGGEILCGVVGVGLAFTLSQATFPWLVLAFWVQLVGTLGLLAVVQRLARRTG